MSAITEDPLLIIVLGAITSIILGFAWLQTGRKQFVVALGMIVAVIIAVVVIERTVVTDREKIDNLLHEVARAVERNDLQRVFQFIHAEAPGIRAQAENELPRYQFHSVNIKSNLEISFDIPDAPTEATATFNVLVIAKHRNDPHEWRVPRFVTIHLRKDGEDWKVYAYDHREFSAGMTKKQSQP